MTPDNFHVFIDADAFVASGRTKAHELESLLPWNWTPQGAEAAAGMMAA